MPRVRNIKRSGGSVKKPAAGEPLVKQNSSDNVQGQAYPEDIYRSILEVCPDAAYKRDLIYDRYDYISPAIEAMTGLKVEEFSSLTLADILGRTHPEDVPLVKQSIKDAASTGEGTMEYRFRQKQGGYRWLSDHFVVVRDREGRPRHLLGAIRDITDRKAIEEELTRIRDRLEVKVHEGTAELARQTHLIEFERDRLVTLIDSMNDGIWLADAGGKILLTNRAARKLTAQVGLDPGNPYGAEALSKVDVFTLDGKPIGIEMLGRVLQGSSVRMLEIGVRNRASGDTFYRRLSANRVTDRDQRVLGVVVVIQDITDQKRMEEEKNRLEEQLRQAQKMEAIGTLAGGIAHDFNNMLAIIVGNAELALDDAGATGPRRNIENIVEASKRATDLVKQILTFSRKTEKGKNALNLTPLVSETFKLLRASLPSTIDMALELDASYDTVVADPSEIEQVLMNLATNAAYDMREKGGELSVGLSNVTLIRKDKMPQPGMKPGRYVKLTVKDTGRGIGEEVKKRIFEPFYTTKEVGQGTGMGLAVVYGIVKSHGGAIYVDSKPGVGSMFSIFLPCTEAPAEAEEAEAKGDLPTGKEKILFVDDEASIVETASQTLGRLGYDVTFTMSAPEALRMFHEEPYRFDLVITDQTMPHLTGIDLARKMLRSRKDLPIVLMTGYNEAVSPEKAKSAGVSEFVMKPVVKRELAKTVRRVLDHRNRDSG